MVGIALALTPLVQTNPQQWEFVGQSDNSFNGIDVGYITTIGERRRFWSIVTYNRPENGFTFALGLQEIDCQEWKGRTLQGTFFRADGTSTRSTDAGDNWTYIVPGTINEANGETICHGVRQGVPVSTTQEWNDAARVYFEDPID